ncbi:hypothetical protein [Jeotgalibacillus marinus]|uniref:SHOCT domain-containing protein n=1 Tax=Jeotgalibacillus marinus TaxID=86667 RepID=A0ABV3Q5K6_9BACL
MNESYAVAKTLTTLGVELNDYVTSGKIDLAQVLNNLKEAGKISEEEYNQLWEILKTS